MDEGRAFLRLLETAKIAKCAKLLIFLAVFAGLAVQSACLTCTYQVRHKVLFCQPAGHPVTDLRLMELGFLLGANIPGDRAARMEATTLRRIQGAGNVAFEKSAVARS